MPTPCESWPFRLASTRLVATRSASRSDEPPALTMLRTTLVREAALTVRYSAMMSGLVEADGVVCGRGRTRSRLRHHAPFSDDGLAHLAGILRAGDLIDLERDFLAVETFQLRRLGVVVGDDLKRFRPGLQAAQPVRRRQAARFAGELIGCDVLALFDAANAERVEFA